MPGMEQFAQFSVDQQRLYGMLHSPDTPAPATGWPSVVVLHGFTGNRIEGHRNFVLLARKLAARGVACLRFDFRGSGESQGDFSEMTPASLQQALQRGTRLLNLLLDDVRLELRHDARRATVVLLPNDRPVKVFAHETLVIVLQALICWLIDRRIPLLEAQFAYPAPAWAEEYPRIYSRNIAFDAALTQFSFPVTDLRAPVVQTERTLREFLRDAPANVIVKYRNPRSLSTYLRHALKHRKHGFELSFDAAAQELGLSPSTLRRRLEAEGTSFRLIKDGARRDVAIRQLQQTRRSIPEVAESLGFAESSAFHRAFIKWMGISPGQFRQSGRDEAGR